MKRFIWTLMALLLIVGCGQEEPVDPKPDQEEMQWGTVVIGDSAIYRGSTGIEVDLELLNTPQEFQFILSQEVQEVLEVGDFQDGRELVVQIRPDKTGKFALVERIRKPGHDSKVEAITGTYMGRIGQSDLATIEIPGHIMEFSLDPDIKEDFFNEVNVNSKIVIYYIQQGTTKTIVDFE